MEQGIRRQLTNAYTPHQNGVAKRKNKTVMNLVRSMLYAKHMPRSFWPEAVMWTFYVLNCSPTLAVKDIAPQEASSGVKPSVDHFRVWGCLAHVHIPEEKRGKLDIRNFICILFGVSEESKGYKLYDHVLVTILSQGAEICKAPVPPRERGFIVASPPLISILAIVTSRATKGKENENARELRGA
ncbi:hypothetical protein ACLB2K_059098 [Fragaria x ananassa]